MSAVCRRLHSDFENALRNEKTENRLDDTNAESQTTGHSAMVSGRFKMPFRIYKGFHRSALQLHQPGDGTGRATVKCLVRAPPLLIPVVKGHIVHAGSAWTDPDLTFLFAAETIRYHFQFFKKEYGPPDAIRYLLNFKHSFLQPPPTIQNGLDAIMSAVCTESLAVEKPVRRLLQR